MISAFISFNLYAFLYGAKVTIHNKTDDDLFLCLVSVENNINMDQSLILDNPRKIEQSPRKREQSGRIHLKANSTTIVYLDNFYGTGKVNYFDRRNSITYYSLVRDIGIEPVIRPGRTHPFKPMAVITSGKINIKAIPTTETTFDYLMCAHFNDENPQLFYQYKETSHYRVKATPDYGHCKLDHVFGNFSELTLTMYSDESSIK